VKRDGKDFIYATPDTLIFPGDQMIVSGTIECIERFAAVGTAG
jgi:trk system potassium uptake protein TrkA